VVAFDQRMPAVAAGCPVLLLADLKHHSEFSARVYNEMTIQSLAPRFTAPNRQGKPCFMAHYWNEINIINTHRFRI
jgi:hypothetical protein